jgi:hypothetical protein
MVEREMALSLIRIQKGGLLDKKAMAPFYFGTQPKLSDLRF